MITIDPNSNLGGPGVKRTSCGTLARMHPFSISHSELFSGFVFQIEASPSQSKVTLDGYPAKAKRTTA